MKTLVFFAALALTSSAFAKDPKLIKSHRLSDGYYPTYELLDMDGDKDLDVVVWGEKQIRILVNKKKRKFKPRFVLKKWKTSVAIHDMDGDKDLDLVVASSHPDDFTLAWLENVGKAKAWKTHVIETKPLRYGVAAGDVDGDGDPDIITLGSEGLDLHVNNGKSKSFEEGTPIHPERRVHSFKLADLDGDKDLDMYITDGSYRKCAWMKNDGSGTNFERILLKKCDGFLNTVAVDMDKDGDLDLLTGADELLYFENVDGKGSFGNEVLATKLNSGVYVTVADIDGDGDLDIGTLNRSVPGQVGWLKNDDGDFEELKTLTKREGLAKYRFIKGGDVDRDGDIDFVYATDSNMLLWENGVKR